MAQQMQPVRLEEADWPSVLPFLRLLGAFRLAIHPPRMLLALFLVTLLYVGGRGLDLVWPGGPSVYPGEVSQYAQLSPDQFFDWRSGREEWTRGQLFEQIQSLSSLDKSPRDIANSPDRFAMAIQYIHQHYNAQRQALRQSLDAQAPGNGDRAEIRRRMEELYDRQIERVAAVRALEPRGVFESILMAEVGAFQRLINAATSLRFGLRELVVGQPHQSDTVIGALRDMVFAQPGWLLHVHRGFLAVYMVFAMLLWSLLGGAIARMIAVHATRHEQVSTGRAVAFAGSRWLWFLLSPLMPLLLAGFIGMILSLGGAVFFNASGLDLVGGLLFPVAMVLGLVIAVLVVGLAAAVNLLYPAIAVEGTDAFDALSRAFNYVLGRPWRWAFYTLLSIVYGAVTYLFVGSMLFLALLATHHFVGMGVFRETAGGVSRFDAMWPAPRLGQLAYQLDWTQLPTTGKIGAALIWVWVKLTIGLLAAYAICFYLSANTWVYLLLRRSADGTEFDEVHLPPPPKTVETPAAAEAVDKADA